MLWILIDHMFQCELGNDSDQCLNSAWPTFKVRTLRDGTIPAPFPLRSFSPSLWEAGTKAMLPTLKSESLLLLPTPSSTTYLYYNSKSPIRPHLISHLQMSCWPLKSLKVFFRPHQRVEMLFCARPHWYIDHINLCSKKHLDKRLARVSVNGIDEGLDPFPLYSQAQGSIKVYRPRALAVS